LKYRWQALPLHPWHTMGHLFCASSDFVVLHKHRALQLLHVRNHSSCTSQHEQDFCQHSVLTTSAAAAALQAHMMLHGHPFMCVVLMECLKCPAVCRPLMCQGGNRLLIPVLAAWATTVCWPLLSEFCFLLSACDTRRKKKNWQNTHHPSTVEQVSTVSSCCVILQDGA
jgi:hypothetical protein